MSFTTHLRQERLRRHLTQEALAEAVGVSPRSIVRWEQGQAIPQASVRLLLCRFFGLRPDELFADDEEHIPCTSLWSVPYPRNPFFTGRAEILHSLREHLTREHTLDLTQSLAISGLGGIGKTQIALEYAYQYRQDYRFVFWTSAATRETLQAGIATLADLLQLPERNEQDQNKIVQSVRRWFATNEGWLWILDNADDVAMVHDILPTQRPGHLLFTTRAQALGTLAQRIEVETMGMTEGTLFLLRRAKLLTMDMSLDSVREDDLTAAEAIVLEMDFLPLALDQAGAYIEEIGCNLSAYLELYRTHRKELLQRRGHLSIDHPEPVATTWSLSFQKVEQANPAAADLLRLCAFLAPDSIPEELISDGSAHLGPALAPVAMDALSLNEAMEELRRFSLLQRNSETKMVRIHRLVQSVLKDALDMEAQRQWAQRAIYAVNTVFPQHIDMSTWSRCRRYLAQAQSCSALSQDYALTFEQLASLLFRTATYLQVYDLHEQAKPLFQRALSIQEQVTGLDHPEVARSLNGLAALYQRQGEYKQAEPLYQRAIHIQEVALGAEHLEVTYPLNGLASLYKRQGKYKQAEPLYQRSIHILEQVLGSEHADLILPLNGLANLYREQGGKGEQAEQLYQRALHIGEEALEPEHPKLALVLNNLALLYGEQGRYEQAESLFQRSIYIQEQGRGLEHPEVARALSNLAQLYSEQEKYEQAEALLQRAMLIREQAWGPEHPDLLFTLRNLAHLYGRQKKYEQAEQLCQRAIANGRKALGPEHPDLALVFHELANVYAGQAKYEQAEPLYQQATHMQEQARGREHSYVSYALNDLANLYRAQGKYEQAEPLYQRVLHIREQALGLEHPDMAETLYDLAVLREAQGNYQAAAPLCQRALTIREQVLGPTHPKTLATRTLYTRLDTALK